MLNSTTREQNQIDKIPRGNTGNCKNTRQTNTKHT